MDRSLNLSGIDEQWELIGRSGMDELARSIEMHRVDTGELPQHLLVPEVWVEGGTTKPLAKKVQKMRVKNPTKLSSNELVDWRQLGVKCWL